MKSRFPISTRQLRAKSSTRERAYERAGIKCDMSCEECERLSRAEIEATRQAAEAEADLQAYYPESPFGEVAAEELRRCQRALEESRAAVNLTRTRRTAHEKTHLLTISN